MSDPVVRTKGPIGFGLRRMIETHPLHAALVERWRVVSSQAIPTAAVSVGGDLRVELSFNPDFVAALTVDELANVLIHECHHVLFSHLAMTPVKYPDRTALVVAQEVTVNEFIPGPLPGSPLRLDRFPELPPSETTDARYHRLCHSNHGPVPNHWCGVTAAAVGQETMRVLVASDVEQAIDSLPEPHRHRALQQLSGLSASGAARVAAMSLDLPAGDVATVDWPLLLRRFVWTLTDPAPSRHRPSRRFPDLVGLVAGRARIPLRPRIMAVLDTSGSMVQGGVLARVRAELRELSSLASLLIVECDTDVRREYSFAGDITNVWGGGGTSFRRPLAKDFLASRRVDAVVYFTDGRGDAAPDPPIVPLVWCLLGDTPSPARWGSVIRVPVD